MAEAEAKTTKLYGVFDYQTSFEVHLVTEDQKKFLEQIPDYTAEWTTLPIEDLTKLTDRELVEHLYTNVAKETWAWVEKQRA